MSSIYTIRSPSLRKNFRCPSAPPASHDALPMSSTSMSLNWGLSCYLARQHYFPDIALYLNGLRIPHLSNFRSEYVPIMHRHILITLRKSTFWTSFLLRAFWQTVPSCIAMYHVCLACSAPHLRTCPLCRTRKLPFGCTAMVPYVTTENTGLGRLRAGPSGQAIRCIS